MNHAEFRKRQLDAQLILLEAVTREQFERVHGPGSANGLRKSQLISGDDGARFVRRTALDEGPLNRNFAGGT